MSIPLGCQQIAENSCGNKYTNRRELSSRVPIVPRSGWVTSKNISDCLRWQKTVTFYPPKNLVLGSDKLTTLRMNHDENLPDNIMLSANENMSFSTPLLHPLSRVKARLLITLIYSSKIELFFITSYISVHEQRIQDA